VHESSHLARSSQYEHDIVLVGRAQRATRPLHVPAAGQLAREIRIGMIAPKLKNTFTNVANRFVIRWLGAPKSEARLVQRSWI
jgi:hypothetical protein